MTFYAFAIQKLIRNCLQLKSIIFNMIFWCELHNEMEKRETLKLNVCLMHAKDLNLDVNLFLLFSFSSIPYQPFVGIQSNDDDSTTTCTKVFCSTDFHFVSYFVEKQSNRGFFQSIFLIFFLFVSIIFFSFF